MDANHSQHIDELCDEFHHEWKKGSPLDIAAWCGLVPEAIRPDLLARLIVIDAKQRTEFKLEQLTLAEYALRGNVPLVTLKAIIETGDVFADAEAATRCYEPTSLSGARSTLEDTFSQLKNSVQAVDPHPVPKSIAGCQILNVIAAGGMGVVYRAWQPGVNRYVAIKILKHVAVCEEETIRQFQTEAEASGRLQHPGIVRIYSAGKENWTHYIIMELVEGETLESFLGDSLLDNRRTAQIALSLAETMSFAHDRGVIHRDLKPSNILMDAEGCPRITDFGLARLEDSDSSMTATGRILGTPLYMSPEQVTGDRNAITSSVDIWAIGIIIYRCLVGRSPFHAGGGSTRVMECVLQTEPTPLHQQNRDVEPDLETICLRCLQKDPADRPASARFLAEELRRYLNNEPIQLRPVSGYQQMLRWCRRNPRAAMMRGALAALVLMVLSGIPLLLWQASLIAFAEQQQQLSERTISEIELREELHRERVHQAEESAKEQAHIAEVQKYYATVMEAGEVSAAREPGWTWKTINLVQRAADTRLEEIDDVRLRSLAADALTSIDVLKVQTFCEGLRIDAMGISHNGGTLALPEVRGAPTCNVHLLSIVSGETSDPQTPFQISPSRLISMNTNHLGFRSAAFSKDGRFCATGAQNGTLTMWDLATAVPTRVYQKEFGQTELDQILFSPNERHLFIRHIFNRCVRTLDRETGEELASRVSDVLGMMILPEGRLLLAEVSSYVVVNAESLAPVGEPSTQKMWESYRPGESRVFTANRGENIDVFDARTLLPGTSMQKIGDSGTWVYSHRSLRDAATIIAAIDPSSVRIWDGLSGRHLMDLSAAGSNIPNVCVDERAHRLFLMTGGVGTAFQVRAPGSGTDGQPATKPDSAMMDFIAPGAQRVDSFELNPAGDEIAVFESLPSVDGSIDSHRWQVRRMNPETRETLATWSFCKLHSTKPVLWGARPRGLTYAGSSDVLYLGTSMPNGLFRLSGDGFDVMDRTLSPSLSIALSTVHENAATFQLPEVIQDDCKHVRVTVECFAPRALDLEHESMTVELQTSDGVVAASATGRQLSERGWYLLELDIVALDQLSSPTQLTCRLHSEELTLSDVSEDANTSMLIGDVLLFPQATGHIHNYTIGPLTGLADGTLAAVSPEESVQFWGQDSEQPFDRWADVQNKSPGLRAIASSTDRVLVGTRFGNAFILQKGEPAWRVLGNVIDEGVENGRAISSVELSYNSQLALVGRKDGSVDALDLSERPPSDLNSGIKMKNEISAIAVSRDRTMLATGDRDEKLKFWQIDGDSFREFFQLSSLRSPVRKMRFSPDGRDLFVLCDDERAVRILHLSTLESEFEKLDIPPVADHTR